MTATRTTARDIDRLIEHAVTVARRNGVHTVHGYPVEGMRRDSAYGGHSIAIIVTPTTGIHRLTDFGYQPARVVVTWLRGFITALENK